MSPDVTPHFFIEMLSAAISVLILTGYHVWLWWRVQREPAYTVQAIHAMARNAWVQSIMEDGRDILAIQTLRNSTMAATLMASTAVLLIVGVLTLSGQGDKLQITWSALKSFNGTDPSALTDLTRFRGDPHPWGKRRSPLCRRQDLRTLPSSGSGWLSW